MSARFTASSSVITAPLDLVTTTPVPPVEVDLLREEIRKTYAAVSQEPEREFNFPTGCAWAEDLDYPAELANVPDSAVESFAGVANPFSLANRAWRACARPGFRSGNRFARRRANGRPLGGRNRHRHDARDARQGTRRAGWSLGLIGILVLVAGVLVLFKDRYPKDILDLVLGLDRWVLRVVAYGAFMTREYPPFRLDAGPHEPRFDMKRGETA